MLLVRILFCAAVVLSCRFAEAKPFIHAFIFNGGGLRTALFLGVLQSAIDHGKSPDVIIGTCGGSLAAALANTHPSRPGSRTYLEILQSESMHRLMLSVKVTEDGRLLPALKMLLSYNTSELKPNRFPGIFAHQLLSFSERYDQVFPELSAPPSADSGIRVIIQAAQINQTPDSPRKTSLSKSVSKTAKVTYFTDALTAKLLTGYSEPLGRLYPESAVRKETQTYSDVSLQDAVRASVSDPYMFSPARIGDGYFVTGAVDLYPYELASSLAENVSFIFTMPLKPFLQNAAIATFKYDTYDRVKQVYAEDYLYSVDSSDFESLKEMKAADFWAKFDLPHLRFKMNIPEEGAEFRSRIRKLYDYGYERMSEAIQHPHSKAHVRDKSPLKARH